MIITDPISDMLTRIRNAIAVKKQEVVLPYSKLKHNLADLLLQHQLLEKVEALEYRGFKNLRLVLKYNSSGLPVISELVRMSKPGQRIYAKSTQIPRPQMGKGITIISTSQGLMSDQEARKTKVGGEVICQIW